MKFKEIPYRRVEREALLRTLSHHIEQLKTAQSEGEALAAVEAFEKAGEEFETASSLAYIRNSIDTRDPYYQEERKFNDDLGPFVSEKTQEFLKALLQTPYRKELEKEYGTLFFENAALQIKGFSPEIISLMQEENALAAEYEKLYASAKIPFMGKTLTVAQLAAYKENPDREIRKKAVEAEGGFFDEHRDAFDDIYDQLVKNRTKQAKTLGFENYVELSYIRQMRNCYTAKDVDAYRNEVIEQIVPITVEIKANQAKRIGVDHIRYWDQVFCFPDGNASPKGTPEEILAAGKGMYEEMSKETREFIQKMFDMELFDVLAKEGKAPGGYCASLPLYQCPFIFSNFNGTSGDVDVLTHEAGHAFADYIAGKEIRHSFLRNPTMEACETHSMSMEFLTAPWHHLFFKEDTKKYELSHAEDALVFIPYGCLVDHFQEEVYRHPEMTPEERNQTWARLEKQYRPYLDMEGVPFYGRGAGWQRQLHIYLYPFYYIDYSLAQTAALQMWVESMKDWDEAWKKYMAFLRQGGTNTFVGLVESVGLRSPFRKGALTETAKQIRGWLERQEI